LGDLPPGASVEGFDLANLNYTEEIGDINGYQELVLVRMARQKKSQRVWKLKNFED